MIQFLKGTTKELILTLQENQELAAPNFLFYFEHRTTKDIVAFVILNADDVSLYKNRYNQFDIVVNNYFQDEHSGEWLYYIYEQNSTTNTNPDNAQKLLEEGIMMLENSTQFEFTKYQTNNNFITP